MDKKEISYEIIDYSGITNVKFYTSTDNGSYIPSHWHRAVEILYMQEGELDVTVESSSFTIYPGDCILVNANVIHSTKCVVPNKAIVLQIPLDFMEKYIPDVQQFMFIWDYQTKDPVHVILERHGFTNYKLFRRIFQEHFGCTPTKVRENVRK